MSNESISKTVVVATGVCVVCSVLVSTAAVFLKPIQDANRLLDRKKNILLAAGLMEPGQQADIDALFKRIEPRLVDLDTGKFLDAEDPAKFSLQAALKDPSQSRRIPSGKDIAGIQRRPNHQVVYLFRDGQTLKRIILPVHGKGLWSTMWGFLALGPDMNTVKSFAFYEHGETPGLGGEVDNPAWKALWVGKEVYDGDNPKIAVVKGHVEPNSPGAEYKVDGLSGATLTGNGVTNLLHYWLGQNGYEPLLTRMKNGGPHE